MTSTPRVILLLLNLALVTCSSVFNVGVVTSMTGPLTDWNSTARGYEFWLYHLNKVVPTGIPIRDSTGSVYYYTINLTIQDDQSNSTKHDALVTSLVAAGGSDIVMNANPSFAVSEATIVGGAKKINLHAVTSNSDVFTGSCSVPGSCTTFGMSPIAEDYTTSLFQNFKVKLYSDVVFVYMSDNVELTAACQAAMSNAKLNLLRYSVIPYTSPMNLTSVAGQVKAATLDALVGCMPSADAALLYTALNAAAKPIKSLYFTLGPNNATWNGALGSISTYLLGPSLWEDTLDKTYTDAFYGGVGDFDAQFAAFAGFKPNDQSAAAAAAGFVLYNALTQAFLACDLSLTLGDSQKLLYDPTKLSCSDNLNNGMQRLARAIQQTSETTFFGNVAFNKYGQNYASEVGNVQVYPVTIDLKNVQNPFLVSPISMAVTAVTMPQPNRYAPICPPGGYQNPNDYLPCISCTPGLYQDTPGQQFCDICPVNTFTNTTGSSSCTSCPANTITPSKGAQNVTECICKIGYYDTYHQSGHECLECPTNAICDGAFNWPRPTYGWYAETEAPFKMFNCNPNLFCLGNFTCAAGYNRRMCSYCDNTPGNQHFMALSRCYKCPSSGATIVVLLAIMYIGFVVLNAGTTRSIECFHILVNFCQLLSIVNGFNTNWPNQISNLMNFAGILAFETDVLQPQCLNSKWDYSYNLVTQLLMPIAMFAVVALWIGFTYTIWRIKMKVEGKDIDGGLSVDISRGNSFASSTSLNFTRSNTAGSMGSATMAALTSSGWLLVVQNFLHIPGDKSEMMEVIYDRLSIPLLFLNTSYMATLKYCLSAFFCYDFMGTKYMYYMSEEQCYTTKHYNLMMIATAGLLFYCGGLWLLIANMLPHLKKAKALGDKVPLLLFGWLYDMYHAQYYWYEIVYLVQKTLFVAIMVFMLDYPDIQLFVCFIIAASVLVLDVKCSPIVDPTARAVSVVSGALIIVTLIIGIMLDNPLMPDATTSGLNGTLSAIIIAFLAGTGLIIVIEIALIVWVAVLKSRHKNIAKKWGHKVKKYRHMYHVFSPWFMVKWLSKAKIEDWQDFHRLCVMMVDFVHPTSEVSYLSSKKVGRFWRHLVKDFPETLDYLASVDEEQRVHFNNFIEVMYIDYFESADDMTMQLNHVVNETYRAPMAQWLSQADESELEFVRRVMKKAFEKAHGEQAAEELTRAMNRSSHQLLFPTPSKLPKDMSYDTLSPSNSLLVRPSILAGYTKPDPRANNPNFEKDSALISSMAPPESQLSGLAGPSPNGASPAIGSLRGISFQMEDSGIRDSKLQKPQGRPGRVSFLGEGDAALDELEAELLRDYGNIESELIKTARPGSLMEPRESAAPALAAPNQASNEQAEGEGWPALVPLPTLGSTYIPERPNSGSSNRLMVPALSPRQNWAQSPQGSRTGSPRNSTRLNQVVPLPGTPKPPSPNTVKTAPSNAQISGEDDSVVPFTSEPLATHPEEPSPMAADLMLERVTSTEAELMEGDQSHDKT